MIKYALQCERGHGFESWFPDSAAYETQRKRGLVDCPSCGSIKIEKQIMAPHVRTRGTDRPAESAPTETTTQPLAAAPDQTFVMVAEQARQLRAMIRELHARVVASTEDVGAKFAEEARKIHSGEAEERAIRGKASLAEAIELHEEGIGVMPLPMLPDERN
jgi:hypothetical protein